MSTFWYSFPQITVIGLGKLVDRPVKAESTHHGYWAWDIRVLYMADNNLDWITTSGISSGTVTSSTDPGETDEIRVDNTYLYYYTGSNWVRIAWNATPW